MNLKCLRVHWLTTLGLAWTNRPRHDQKTHKTSKLVELDKTENSHKCLLSLSHSSCVDHKLFDAIDLDGLKLLLRSMP